MKLIICLCLAAWPSVLAMYFTGEKEIFQAPNLLRNDSYFGYSITYDQKNTKLVISAPRENNIGAVYDCDIPSRSCSNVPVTIDRNSLPAEYNHDFWFGATVKSGPNFVMMCAPRYTQNYISKSDKNGFNKYVTFGKCFSHENGKMVERRQIVESERNNDAESEMETRMDSFGWSIDVASDDSILVGGPGMFHGRVMIYKPRVNIPIFIKYNKDMMPEFDFGYSVASGMFLDKKLYYAIGSPYGTSGLGEVLFYQKVKLIRKLIKGEDTDVVGSMFGAVLCAAKMSNKFTDLIVGAPTYAKADTYNLGAVYVYLNPKSNKLSPIFKRRIVGESAGAQFGSAIANVGDLNGDHKDEIAISAPFENDGSGVVYLYSGRDLISDKPEMTLKWMQKIEPEPSYAKSFGLSLTPLLDYDRNGCNELAIGSPYNDTVVLLRCLAAITVQTSAKFPNLKDRATSLQINYNLTVCLTVTYPTLPEEITARLSTTVMMIHSSARLAATNDPDGFRFETDLKEKRGEYCNDIPFILPIDGKYDTEINYAVKTKLIEDPMQLKKFDRTRVILSDRSVLQVIQAAWAAECAGKICVPNFIMTPSLSFDIKDNKYIIDSTKTEHISVSMVNNGEVAYDTCLRVEISGTRVLRYPPACQTNGTSLLCMPITPIRHGNKWDTGSIDLDMKQLNNLDKNVTVNITRYDYCKNAKPTEIRPYTIDLKPDPSGIAASGENDIGAIVDVTREEVTEKGKKMTHVYTLTNSGPTHWAKLQVKVKLENNEFVDDVSVHVSDTYNTMNCDVDPSDNLLYICVLESLRVQKDVAKILIPMFIKPNKELEEILEEKNVTISTSISFEPVPGDVRDNTRISTLLTLKDAKVPLAIIISAVVVGLLFVIIIAFILYRVGFLQRKKKQELEKLRRSVKRQTILRRSTMPNQNSPQSSQQRRPVLEELKDTDEDILVSKK
ncbi:integrin alpha-PS4 isoform X1 [Spodoptera frugiperda]|uniref:Integrin alpha-PS4 isoform X1 n=1 Tax=Spodoptera frugiperda TaxID=7108 RepID=A0A9R0E6F9_SPOFR|nr:integrin alpha-PS4 isoform X1 [Spodoptera frugiperda]